MIEILSTVGTSKSFQATEQKRALVIERLQAAKLCEVMGKEPWSLIPNSAYNQCGNPCISVIVTLFNYSEYIYECLDSISNSEFSDLPGQIEVLVVDDCSTDRSASMVEEYMNKSTLPICLIKKSFNTGLADARNVGLKVARSPYVFILDADNWIHPNCLSILYHTINSSIYAGVYSSIRRVNHQTREELAGLISCDEWNVQKLVECPYIDAMAMLNREILLKVGGYSTELIEYGWFGWEDYDLWLKLAQYKYSCKLVSKVLSSYRVHPTSMINTTNYYTLIIAKYFSKKFSDLVKNYWKSDKLFGFEQNEIFSLPQPEEKPEDKLERTEKQLESAEKHLQELQQQMEKNLQELQQAYTTIAAIQSSKFWQVRNNWFKFKKLLGLADGTEVKI
ncbi:MAG TPA: glycosyl transferase family 2 [Cyanobacteria bacterium UBA11049]|nr:glycosyl transferase family 2 [Cyanobacteria bacterium UBA11049]